MPAGLRAGSFGSGWARRFSRRSRRRRRVGLGGLGLVAAEVGGDDEEDFLLDVVEGENLIEEHEAGVGHAEVVGGGLGQALDLADDVVRKKADGSGGKGRKAGNAGGRVSVEGVAEESEDVAGDAAGAAVLGDFDGIAVRDNAAAGADADVGVAAEMLAAFDGFEEETLGLGSGDAEKGGDGGFEVGGEGAVERDEGMGAGEAQELGAFGMGWPHGSRVQGGVLREVLASRDGSKVTGAPTPLPPGVKGGDGAYVFDFAAAAIFRWRV